MSEPNSVMDFDRFYERQWGTRWPELRAALKQSKRRVARVNRFASPEALFQQFGAKPSQSLNGRLYYDLAQPLEPVPDQQGLLTFYPMDLASLLPPIALANQAGEMCLDMCAAPGGKSLLMIEQSETGAGIVLNEISRTRRRRLHRVLESYLPATIRAEVKVTGFDASRSARYQAGYYDAILLDAPCSSEQHVLCKPGELSRWTPKRSRQLAQRQYALLRSAFTCLKPGGRVVYATCSVSQLENDGVVQRVLEKGRGQLRSTPLKFEIGKATRWGWQVCPDRDAGWGPLYLARLERATNPE